MSSTTAAGDTSPSPSPPPEPSTSKNPLTLLSSLDSSKKYTLVFLVSVGTTLLVTGASGGRLLKRAKKVTATESNPASTAASTRPRRRPPQPPPSSAPKPVPIPRWTTTTSYEGLTPNSPAPIFADPTSLTPPRKSLLRTFRRPHDDAATSSTSAYFLPNTQILAQSTAFAENLDTADKLHQDGTLAHPDAPEDGFNPALYAFKAFAIATVITFTSFGIGIVGLMKWFGVNDLEGLSLALSHSLPNAIDARRPTVPQWASPPQLSSRESHHDSDSTAEANEEMSYWRQVKETLDEEAAALKAERRRAWEERVKARELRAGGQA